MLHALAIVRFSQKARDGGLVIAQLLAQHFHGDGAVIGMLGSEDTRRASLAHFVLQGVSSDCLSYQILARHAANLIATAMRGKRVRCTLELNTCASTRERSSVVAAETPFNACRSRRVSRSSRCSLHAYDRPRPPVCPFPQAAGREPPAPRRPSPWSS